MLTEKYLKPYQKNKKLMNKGQQLYKKAKTMIPGGNMLLSKRPELFFS